MKILTYRELKSKDGLLPLLDHAFRWTYNQRTFEKLAKIDPRLKDGPVGFCAIEDGDVVGYVGVMDMATRTLGGNVELVGGVYGVATLPRCVRRGVSSALMSRAHQYFADKSYRFSFLTTSHTIIAHSFYEKLGYEDLLGSPSAYKVLINRRVKSRVKQKASKLDLDKILEIYDKYVKGKTGFVVRDEAYLKMLKTSEGLTGRQCIIDDYGYVLFKEEKNGIWIRELAALNPEKMDELVSQIEGKAKDFVYDRAVLDGTLRRIYKSRGYMTEERSHSVMMIKPLTANAPFKQTYGEKFSLMGLDFF